MSGKASSGLPWWVYAAAITVPVTLLLAAFVLLVPETERQLFYWGSTGVIGGIYAFVRGFGRLRRRRMLQNTPTSKVRSVAVGDVEVEGSARSQDQTIPGPISGTDALLYQLEVEEWDEWHWDTVLELVDQVDFEVDDGTGRLPVDANGAELYLEDQAQVEVDPGEEPPARIRDWAFEEGPFAEAGPDELTPEDLEHVASLPLPARVESALLEETAAKRRYTERLVQPGEAVVAFGEALPEETGDDERLVLQEPESSEPFILSDREEADLQQSLGVQTVGLLAGSVLAIPAGTVALLMAFGFL